MRSRDHIQGFTIAECLIAIILTCMLFSIVAEWRRLDNMGLTSSASQNRKINNARKITAACSQFAADHAGVFPNGNFDPSLFQNPAPDLPVPAEQCFNPLVGSLLLVEKDFWDPHHSTHCYPGQPDEWNGLEPGENGWDYIAGLSATSKLSLPLIFEASANGDGLSWPDGGSPRWDEEKFGWEKVVIVGYIDGSAEKVPLDENRQAQTKRGGHFVHLCVPIPGKNNCETAKLAPATPID